MSETGPTADQSMAWSTSPFLRTPKLPMRFPPALHPNDTIHVVAPSSPFDRTLAWRGLGWLRERYRVRFDRGLFDTEGYLAGSDTRRRQELDRAFRSRECRAVVAVRGGYGLNRIAHQLDWVALRTAPKWIVGFSDITALHVEATANGIASLHGPMVAVLGRGDAAAREAWIDALEHPTRPRSFNGLNTLHAGAAEGPVFGGNLAMLHACAAAGRLHVPPNAILFIEDVGERPYRIDRTLTTLSVGGHFDKVGGVILGEFTACDPGVDGTCVQDVVRGAFAPFGVPVVNGFPMGHGLSNVPLHLGAKAELTADADGARVWVRGPGP